MHSRKKDKKDVDPTTQKLIEKGLINVNSSDDNKKSTKQKVKDFGKVTFDFWSGVKYTIVLSGLLWWLPLFGPMLAGYIGGRRTGGPKKGLLASVLALGLIGGIQYALINGLFPANMMSMMAAPSAALTAAYQEPLLAPYARFLQLYWGAFFTKVIGGLPYSPNSYLITIIFAYVGGVISVEKKKELAESEGINSQINIKLSGLMGRSNNQKTRKVKSPSANKRSKLAKSNFGKKTRANSSRKRLKDLKAIQFKKNRNKKSKKSPKKKSKKKNKKESKKDKKVQKVQKRPVRHHSNTEGDDWEIL